MPNLRFSLKFGGKKGWGYIFLLTLRGSPSNGGIFCSILPNEDYMARETVAEMARFSPHSIKNLAASLKLNLIYSLRVTGMWISIQSRVPAFSMTVSWADIFNILGLCPCFSTNRNRQFQKRMRASRRRLMSLFLGVSCSCFSIRWGAWRYLIGGKVTEQFRPILFLRWRSFYLSSLRLYAQWRASLKPLWWLLSIMRVRFPRSMEPLLCSRLMPLQWAVT